MTACVHLWRTTIKTLRTPARKLEIGLISPALAPVEFAHAAATDDLTRGELGTVILVVDDDPSVRTSTARLLSAHGHTVFEAASAGLILMELHMPDGGGIQAAREIKQRADLSGTPIIALSATPPAWVLRSELFATVLHKPYLSSQLLEALAIAVRR